MKVFVVMCDYGSHEEFMAVCDSQETADKFIKSHARECYRKVSRYYVTGQNVLTLKNYLE